MRRVVTLLAVTVAMAVCVSPSMARPLSTVIPLGGTWEGSVEASTSSAVGVLIPAGARNVNISIRLDRKSGLDPEFSIYGPDGSPIDVSAGGGVQRVTKQKVTVKNLPVGASGLYRFVLRGRDGTSGDYVFKCRGKTAKIPKVKGRLDSPGATDDYLVSVPDGSFLTVKLNPGKKSELEPALTILTADGDALDTAADTTAKGPKTTLKKSPLPFFGGYLIRVTSAAGTGEYSLSVKVKAKKIVPDPGRPRANAGGFRTIVPGGAVALPTKSTAGSRLLWARASGSGGRLAGEVETPIFEAPADGGTHAFQLVAELNGVYSIADTAVIEVDQAPIAVGGPSQSVAAGAAVTLSGADSFDLDLDSTLSWSWRQVSGTSVTLDGAKTVSPTFTAPSTTGVLVFELVVNDGFADSLPDRVLVGVDRDVADAGRPVVVTPDDSVYLSGLRTPGTPGSFAWTRIDGNAATITLSGTDQPVAGFSAPRTPGAYRFRLTTDGDATAADEVLVLVTALGANDEPRAAAGGVKPATTDQAFNLSGAASTGGNVDPLAFEWRPVGTPSVALTGTGPTRSGTAPGTASVIRFLLMVHDGRKYGPPDQATRIVGAAPVPGADAGADVSGAPGVILTLSSTGSRVTPGRTISSRRWVQVTGRDLYDIAGNDTAFDATEESPTIAVPQTGISSVTPDRSILFTLTVTDSQGVESAPDYVVVTFTDLPGNAAPTVTATPSTAQARPGAFVTLLANATDRDGDPLSYAWTQTSGPVTVGLAGTTSANATFTTPGTSGEYGFRVVVDDGTGTPNATTAAEVSVLVNVAPVITAVANPPSAPQGATVTLDGRGTVDPDGDALTWLWQEIPSVGNPAIPITGLTTSKGTFTVIPYAGSIAARTRTFRLIVTDAMGPTQATVTFVPNSLPMAGGVIATKGKIRYDGTDSSVLSIGGLGDPDGDPVTVTWRIVTGPAATGATLAPATGTTTSLTVARPTSSNPSTGGLWTVGATVSDGRQSIPERTLQILAYPSFKNDVWTILSSSCATSSCHGHAATNGGAILYFGIAAPTAYASLVGMASSGSALPRVTKNDHRKSYLWQQVNSGGMPKFGTKLSQEQLNIIRDWIEPEGLGTGGTMSGGAENN